MAKKKYKKSAGHLFYNGSSLGNQYSLFPQGTGGWGLGNSGNSIQGSQPSLYPQGTAPKLDSSGAPTKQDVQNTINKANSNNGGAEDSGGSFMGKAGQVLGFAQMFDSLAQNLTVGIDANRKGVNNQPQVLVEGVLGGQSGSHLSNMWNTGTKTAEAINYVNQQGNVDFAGSSTEDLLAQHSGVGTMDRLNISTKGKEWEDFIFDPLSYAITRLSGRREKASDRQKRINEAIDAVNTRQQSAYNDAVRNFENRVDRQIATNYRAFGGPLDDFAAFGGGALGYDVAKDNIIAKQLANQDKMKNSYSYVPTFANGGLLFDDFTNGVTIVDAGGSHAENPFGGVPMGMAPDGEPNLVEEGESIYKDYVFSKRLRVPEAIRNKYKMRSTNFSDMFKEYLKKNGIDERENDPIAQNGLMAFASDLMVSQEMVRAKRNKGKDSAHAYPTGGKILHDPSKTKENYFNDLYAEGSDYMNAINWYNDPAHTKERDALIAAINAGNFDTDIEKINGFTVTPDNWYALATDYKKGPVHNAILNTMGRVLNPAMPISAIGKEQGVNVQYTPEQMAAINRGFFDQELANGLTRAGYTTPPEGIIDRNGNVIPPPSGPPKVISRTEGDGDGNGAMSVVSEWSRLGNSYRKAGLFANAVGLIYNLADKYRPRELNEVSPFMPVAFTPIGEYAPEAHFDINYAANQQAQMAAATRNAIMNTTAPNRYATMLAADYDALVANGDLRRKASIDAYDNLLKTLSFNRDTSKYNSTGALDAAKANMSGRQAHDQLALQQGQYNVSNYDSYKRGRDQAIGQGIQSVANWFSDYGKEQNNLAMVGALLESGALSSNEAMDLLYGYLGGPSLTRKSGKKKGGV